MLPRKAAVDALKGGEETLVLRRVTVPLACLTDESLRAAADAEGAVSCDVTLAGGTITGVAIHDPTPLPGTGRLDARGSMLWPAFVDAHTHLCKTHAVPRCRNPSGSINDALACEVTDQPRWIEPGDVERRMDFALRSCLHHGTRAVRTHLDGTNASDAAMRQRIYDVFDAKRAEYESRGIVLQGVANLYLPLYADAPEMAARHAADAASHAGVVLGAYCGDVSHGEPGATDAHLDALFALASKHGLDVDLHIDENNNPDCCGVRVLCGALERARERGYDGSVVLGHVTSLALQTAEVQAEVVARLAKLAPVHVVCNPFTNLGLQDRRGTAPPIGKLVARDEPRTPLWRGLTLLQELRAANVPVAAASDNVRDWWHPYGDYDPLQVWREAVAMGHLDTAPSEGAWADLVTAAAADAMGVGGGVIAVGEPADLVLFPGARRFSELLARPHHDRVVVRRGKATETKLPDFSELDDLVDDRAAVVDTSQEFLRGATKKE